MQNLIHELRRRKVFRVAGMYALVSWIIMQIGEVTFPALLLPDWALTLVIVLLIIGFPIAILLSWAYDITSTGIKRDSVEIDRNTEAPAPVDTLLPVKSVPIQSKYLKMGMISLGIVGIAVIGWLALPSMGLFGLQTSAESNSLAVVNFENLRDVDDKDRLGQILQELIITDLSESQSFKIFSSQRLYDIQNQLGQSDSRSIDPSVALEVARRAGASTMLTGNIIQTGNKIILTSRLIEVARGTIIKSQRVEGNDVYAMVDDLTELVRRDLNLGSKDVQDIEIPVIEKTTGSMTAYQHYLEGMDLFNEQHFIAAIDHFQSAIAIDSNFSNVYYTMALAQWWAQSLSSEVSSEQALVSLNYILAGENYKTTKEKLLAESARELISQNFSKATELYTQVVNFLPDEKDGWYGLGEALFHGSGDFEGALLAFEKVIELDPNYKLAYRHIFDIYAAKEQFNEGKMKAVQFISLFPDSPWGSFYLALMTEGAGDYEKAGELYLEALKSDPTMSPAQKNLTKLCNNHLPADVGIGLANQFLTFHPDQASPYKFIGTLYQNIGDFSEALKAFENGLLIDPYNYDFTAQSGYTYQLMGLYDTAQKKFSLLLADDKNERWQKIGHDLLISLYVEQGQISLALPLIDELVNKQSIHASQTTNYSVGKAFHYFLLKDYERAHLQLNDELAKNPNKEIKLNIYLIKSLIHSYLDEPEPISRLVDLVSNITAGDSSDKTMTQDLFQHAILFQNYYAHKDYPAALAEWEKLDKRFEVQHYFLYQKAMIHYLSGDYTSALAVTDEMQKASLSRSARAFVYPQSFYLRGIIYEAMGNKSLARQNLQKLVSIWKSADEKMFNRRDALNRLSRLNSGIG